MRDVGQARFGSGDRSGGEPQGSRQVFVPWMRFKGNPPSIGRPGRRAVIAGLVVGDADRFTAGGWYDEDIGHRQSLIVGRIHDPTTIGRPTGVSVAGRSFCHLPDVAAVRGHGVQVPVPTGRVCRRAELATLKEDAVAAGGPVGLAVVGAAAGAIGQLCQPGAVGAHFPDTALLLVFGRVGIDLKDDPLPIRRKARFEEILRCCVVGDAEEITPIGGYGPHLVGILAVGGEGDALGGGVPTGAGLVDAINALFVKQGCRIAASQRE